MAILNQYESVLNLTGPCGVLEGVWGQPVQGFTDIAMVCHPNPTEEGSMDNKVVTALCRAFIASDMATCRFNYRGVGQSEGVYGDVEGEVADAQAVYAQLLASHPGCNIWFCGFSFGSYIAARLASMYTAAGLIMVAPGVDRLPFLHLGRFTCPVWVIQGEEDEVIPPQAVYDWVEDEASGEIVLVRFADTGHFFHGKLIDLRDRVMNILSHV